MNHYYFEFRDAIKFVKHELNKDPEVAKKNKLNKLFNIILLLLGSIVVITIILMQLNVFKVKQMLLVEQIILIELIGSIVIVVIMFDKRNHLKIDDNILNKMRIEKLSAHLDSCNYTNEILLKIKSDINDNEKRSIKKSDSSLKFFTSIVFGIFVAILPGTANLIGNYVDEGAKIKLSIGGLIIILYIFASGYIVIKDRYNINHPDKIQQLINSIDEVLIYRGIKVEQADKSK